VLVFFGSLLMSKGDFIALFLGRNTVLEARSLYVKAQKYAKRVNTDWVLREDCTVSFNPLVNLDFRKSTWSRDHVLVFFGCLSISKVDFRAHCLTVMLY